MRQANKRKCPTFLSTISIFLIVCITSSPSTDAFTIQQQRHLSSFLRMSSSSTDTANTEIYLTPKLRELVSQFSSVYSAKARYMQLLEIAKSVPDVGPEIQKPENKVPGCLSTVFIDCKAEMDEEKQERVVHFDGWSDGLLTKGMMAVLLQGLDGHTPDEVEKVQPEFIKLAKIDQSLTPGRNNGYLNMLNTMKRKAREAVQTSADDTTTTVNGDENEQASSSSSSSDVVTTFEKKEGKPMYNAIMSNLIALLQPTKITLVDHSDQHAGHAGAKGWEESGESHFELEIVSNKFEGLPLVKRHQAIYAILGDVMKKIHALQIVAKTEKEVEMDE